MNLPGPGDFLPPDPAASIYDDPDNVRDVLEDAGIPDYLADAIAHFACKGWNADRDGAELVRDVIRHVRPIVDEADQRRIADRDFEEAA